MGGVPRFPGVEYLRGMAGEEEDDLPDFSSSSVAAEDAAIKAELAVVLQRYQDKFHNVQMLELSVAAKKEKNKELDEQIKAQELELNRTKKLRENLEKQRVSIQQSVANSAALLELSKAHREIILQQRQRIGDGYQCLIDKKKAKISMYPLVAERDALKNQVLAANVELGVLKYRNAEKKRQNELKQEIEEKQRNDAIVDLAQISVNVKKLEEENSCLLQQLEEAKNPLIPSEGQDETGLVETTDAMDSINELPPHETSINLDNQATDSLPTNEQPVNVQSNGVDGVLKNYREKFQVRMRASSALLPPPVLSVETRYGDMKSAPAAQEISTSANEKSDVAEESTNKEGMSKTDGDECDHNDSGEVVTQQDESTTNDSMQDANVRSTDVVTKSASVTSVSSAERRRAAFPSAAEHGVKYMKTDDFVGARKPSERLFPAFDQIDEGIDDRRQLGTIIARHSVRRLARVRSAVRARREMESALSPEKTGPYPGAQENNVVPSTYFHENPVERRPCRAYDRCGLSYGNGGANRALEKDVDDRRVSGIKKNLAGEDFGADERVGYAPEEEFDFRSDNGDGFDNYSDHNDEIDADEEYTGAPMTAYDDGRPTYSTRVSSKEKSSYEGVVSGQSGKPASFDRDNMFGSSNERELSAGLLFRDLFHHSGDRNDREDLF